MLRKNELCQALQFGMQSLIAPLWSRNLVEKGIVKRNFIKEIFNWKLSRKERLRKGYTAGGR